MDPDGEKVLSHSVLRRGGSTTIERPPGHNGQQLKAHRNLNGQNGAADGMTVLRPTPYYQEDTRVNEMAARHAPEVETTSITSTTEQMDQMESLPSPSSASLRASRGVAPQAVPSSIPNRFLATGRQSASSEFDDEFEAEDYFEDPEDLDDLLREQFNNSIIRLPFVPVVVTHQDVTLEPSMEPQVPLAVAPISVRSAPPAGADSVVRHLPPPSGSLPIEQLNALRQQGFPVGLALEVSESRARFPMRFWSIDNGTSMNERDAKQVNFGTDSRTVIDSCSRWEELQGSVEDQIRLAGLMQISTVFCLRNGVTGQRKFAVADPTSASVENDVKLAIKSVKRSKASGHTPLSKHLREFHKRVHTMESTLRKQGQKAVVVFSVSGLPTDETGTLVTERTKQDFIDALVKLSTLPVWIFIRLCTEEKDVFEFYNNLKLMDLDLVVIRK